MENKARIRLRSATLKDSEIILDWENNLENWAVSANDSAYSLIDIQMLIISLRDVRKACQARYMIIEIKSERILGSVDLYEINWDEKKAGVGVLISNKDDRSNGYASEALILLEKVSIEDWGILHLNAEVHSNNLPSVHLFKKCGYVIMEAMKGANSPNGDYIETILFEKWLKK